jgi:uncharacterized protein
VFLRAALREAGLERAVVLVGEAGASAWGATEAARAEFPDLDPAVRTAISIARRLQDPLAELVRIDLRSVGVGQYHHDVAHATLQRALDAVVEDCVSGVGVDLNRAPRHLLARVAGIGPAAAGAIVEHREKQGPFRSRQQLLELPRVGPKCFEQAAPFLRVPGGEHPLDGTAVHPERYAALETFAARLGRGLAELLGPGAALVREAASLKEELGTPTFEDVLAELEKPGRDPRGPFSPFSFREDVRKIEDLRPGMVCPGVVTNVTSFGAFVDVGILHDGLVHVSQLGSRTAKGGTAALEPGDRVQVRVLKVDLDKRQFSLTMRPAPERRPAPRPRPARRPESAGPASGAPKPSLPAPLAPAVSRPERRAEKRRPPGPPPVDRRPGPRRQVFNNPFAVLAGLKVPAKKG